MRLGNAINKWGKFRGKFPNRNSPRQQSCVRFIRGFLNLYPVTAHSDTARVMVFCQGGSPIIKSLPFKIQMDY
ncbi:unknown protein [Microcystis aeruginosa NIES-843]|uniref:Uncharacterized protein n=1 Tax=Microcystis aeruginosa (strain NIES-843 / IAM M-2473) TaxID=449447 RepID=B0JUY7_MICAN|nr:unknown protein [Microcystis aeruginosa NIES-843]